MTPYRLCRTCGRYVHEDLVNMETDTCPNCEELVESYVERTFTGRAIEGDAQ